MKVVFVNGSPNENGKTRRIIGYVIDALESEGIESEVVSIGSKPVQGCINCGKCKETHRCVFSNDLCNPLIEKIQEADGIVLASPVYAQNPTGSIISLMTRVMRAGQIRHKVGASVVSMAGRTGESPAIDVLNAMLMGGGSFFLPLSSGAYNVVDGDPIQEEEGIKALYTLGKQIAYLVKVIHNYDGELPDHSDFEWEYTAD